MVYLKDVLKEWLDSTPELTLFRVDVNAAVGPYQAKWFIWLCTKFIDNTYTPMWAMLEIKSDRVKNVNWDNEILASDPDFFKKITSFLNRQLRFYKDKIHRDWGAK